MTRIDAKFAQLAAANKKAFVAYVMAGDPDYATSLDIVKGLPGAGVDVIELLSSSSSGSSSGSEADEDDGVLVRGSPVSASSSRNGTRRPNTDGPVGREKQHARWRGKRAGKAANKYQPSRRNKKKRVAS
jgi:hypothetical protein